MKTLFPKNLLLMVFFYSPMAFSQTSNIVKILNENLKNDLKIKVEYNHFDDTIKIVKPYAINKNILSVELEYKGSRGNYIEKQEVDLSKIIAVSKDINVVFDTENNAVKINRKAVEKNNTELDYNGTGSIFFTGIRFQTKNKYLGYHLLDAFDKAGSRIELGNWYD